MARRYATQALLLIAALTLFACSDDAANGGSTSDNATTNNSNTDNNTGNNSNNNAGGDAGLDAANNAANNANNGDASPDTPPSLGGLVINELVVAGGGDWIELYNGGADDVPLEGFHLSDNFDEPTRASFPANLKVPAGGYFAIALSADAFPGFGLSSDEELILSDPDGNEIDSIDWDEGDAPAGASFGRIPNGEGPFKTLLEPTQGTANIDNRDGAVCGDGEIGGDEACDDDDAAEGDGCSSCRVEDGWDCTGAGEDTTCTTTCGDGFHVGREQCDDDNTDPDDGCDADCNLEVITNGVTINEVVSNGVAPETDAVELLNTSDQPIDLSGWSLTDDKPEENRFVFPADTALGAGEYLVLRRDDTDAPNFAFDFNLSGGDAVYLFDNRSERVSVADWIEGDAPEGASWARVPNGTGDFQTRSPPTLGEAND